MTCGGQQNAFAAFSLPQIPTEEEETNIDEGTLD